MASGETPTRSLKKAAVEFRRQFGGGMMPFDNAYLDGKGEGLTEAEAQMAGAYALIESFVRFAETPTQEANG